MLKFLAASLTFAYGIYVFILYGSIAFCKGAWFHRTTEKEKLELLLGMELPHPPVLRSKARIRHVSNGIPPSQPEIDFGRSRRNGQASRITSSHSATGSNSTTSRTARPSRISRPNPRLRSSYSFTDSLIAGLYGAISSRRPRSRLAVL